MPWIPGRVFEALQAAHESEVAGLHREVLWLRTELATAHRLLRNTERVKRRLPLEREPTQAPPREEEAIPAGVMRLVNVHPPQVRDGLLASIRAARAEKTPVTWEDIALAIRGTMPAGMIDRLDAPQEDS